MFLFNKEVKGIKTEHILGAIDQVESNLNES